jgi:hypothetical protein
MKAIATTNNSSSAAVVETEALPDALPCIRATYNAASLSATCAGPDGVLRYIGHNWVGSEMYGGESRP